MRFRLFTVLLCFLAVVSLGGTVAAQDGLFVTPREQVPYCAGPHHRHWIRACGRAILAVEPEEEDGGTIKSWTPEGAAFAEAFVARCAEILPGAADPHDPEECPCTRAEHAEWLAACVDDFHEVEPGMRRRQVEERFRRDGGMVMGGNLRLVHPDCPMLKLDVAYELEPGSSFIDEPEALVIQVGEPYLEHVISD